MVRIGQRWAVVVTVALALAVATCSPAGASEIDDLRAAVTAARDAATQATQRYMDAVNRLEDLEVQIASAERDIAANRERVTVLSGLARDRAVTAYVQRGVDTGALSFDRPLDRLRRAKLLEHANARDNAAIAQLAVATDALSTRETELRDLRADARTARDQRAVEQTDLDKQLQNAQQALDAFEERIKREEAARQEQERARLAAQKQAQSQSGRDYGNAYVATGLICPIRGPVSFIDSWGFPRATTGWHQGVDLMTPRGTPNVAVVSGNVEMHTGATSGNGAWLYGDDGNLYYYFHLDAYEGGSRRVQQGDALGYAGNTGDASGGATHTHFEVHPGGGPAVNPYPTVAGIC
ncbi:MAG: peptidoglycan DD-metalloendopeptidase family protein [Acidimicrobiia bacterium]|jgi:murein DD-endopeptidase MepM/ murein hydrolase activator NlpD